MTQLLTDLYGEERINYLRGYYQMAAQDRRVAWKRLKAATDWAVLELACLFDVDTVLSLRWSQISLRTGHIDFESKRVQWDIRTQNFRVIGDERESFQIHAWAKEALTVCKELHPLTSSAGATLFTIVDIKAAFKSFEQVWLQRPANRPPELVAALVKRANAEHIPAEEIAQKLSIGLDKVHELLRNEPVWAEPRASPAQARRAALKAEIARLHRMGTDASVIALMLGRTFNEIDGYIREIQRDDKIGPKPRAETPYENFERTAKAQDEEYARRKEDLMRRMQQFVSDYYANPGKYSAADFARKFKEFAREGGFRNDRS
jgi:hypothetical protein